MGFCMKARSGGTTRKGEDSFRGHGGSALGGGGMAGTGGWNSAADHPVSVPAGLHPTIICVEEPHQMPSCWTPTMDSPS